LFILLGLDGVRADKFRALFARERPTYREAMAILSPDAEGTYFVYRFSDPTYVMVEALLRALGQQPWIVARRVLDLCGGTGHVTRLLTGLRPAADPVILADVYFWKLWLARRYTAPESAPVCCDANNPLPFPRETFSLVMLLDAFPYIWQRRLLAEEMMRLTGPEGAVVLPHLHSALGENFAAGMPLTPAGYLNLFAQLQPRLFSDTRLFADAVEHRRVDLTRAASPADLGTEPTLTLIASRRADLFRKYEVPEALDVQDELKINPLYRVDRRGDSSVLTLAFPTPEYEEEFGACKQYLPATVTVDADLTGVIDRSRLGAVYEDLRRRRVLIDMPDNY
jgi:SAM-dependent methyltransferase